MVTSGYAGDFSRGSKRDPKAKCLSVLTLLMALSVWVFGAIGSTNPGFAWPEEIGAGFFILANIFVLGGEMILHKDFPWRNVILGILWWPVAIVTIGGAFVAMLRYPL